MIQVHVPRAARLLQVLSFGALLGAAGCSGSVTEEQQEDQPRPSSFEVGSGSESFVPLGPDATINLVEGGQGGYHLWVSFRCTDCGPEVIVRYGAKDAETGELLSAPYLENWGKLEEEDGWRQIVGLIAFLNELDPSRYLGRRVRLWAAVKEMEDETGAEIEVGAEATVSGTEY